jgi:hypothetical protein
MLPGLRHVQSVVGRVCDAGGKSEVLAKPLRGRPGRGQIDEPKTSRGPTFHEVTLPIGSCPASGAVGYDEPVCVDKEACCRGAKGLSTRLGDRFARVRSLKDNHAAPVETDGKAIGRTGGDEGHRLFEDECVTRNERAFVRPESQDLRAAGAEKRATMPREIVDVRERQCDGRSIKESVWPKRAVHHRGRSGFVVKAAKGRIGALEGGDHCVPPQ